MKIENVKLNIDGYKVSIRLEYTDTGRIKIHSGFNRKLIDEIKATFAGYKWHGFEDPPEKIWSILDNEHNQFQLKYLQGMNPYVHYDAALNVFPATRSVFHHQQNLINFSITRRHCIIAAEMGTGKTLVAIEVMELSGFTDWWYIAPKNALASVELEFAKWNSKITPKFMTYEQATKTLKSFSGKAPQGVFCDEAARIKTATSQRSQAIAHLARAIRKEYSYNSYIVAMSGTPAPKSPVDWWNLCATVCPGYLKEGSPDQLKNRLAIIEKAEAATGGFFPKIVAWRDSDKRCNICGKLEGEHNDITFTSTHDFEPTINEVAKLYRRMKGLVEVVFKKDCLDLPEKVYRIVKLEPDAPTMRASKLISKGAKRAIEALTKLRELSDGFQYKEVEGESEICSLCKGAKYFDTENGKEACNFCSGVGHTKTFTRTSLRVATPKDDALIEELETHEDVGRLVIYAGFTESIDRIVEICVKQGWKTIRVDGRGISTDLILPVTGVKEAVYAFQNDDTIEKVAFIGHPGSAGEGLTLTKSPTIIYYSNDFNGGYRIQSEDRIHRIGMDVNRGATIVDFIHLPSDQLVLDNLKRKRELQSITLGELSEALLLDRVD